MSTFLRERWLAVVLAVVAIVFIAQNPDDTRISFLWIHLTWPLWLTLTVVTVIGIVIGSFINRRHPQGRA
ncbi:LapA family protein [Nocardioides nematodiphilus]|uniref:LapA family protein n=1 Tax=Nocardioides nematodiphilus TaxID=2849669 RepID=UPI001CDA12DC|nr:LapA family protein [Nocardioides nematodiphilus]MCA1982902.1 LapA family protein [Nocardioides nematodiphilus]